MISRRQFLRACMYAAPAAIVAPKAIAYFLPPQIALPDDECNIAAYFIDPKYLPPDYMVCNEKIIELIKERINQAHANVVDAVAHAAFNPAPALTLGGVPIFLDRQLPPRTIEIRQASVPIEMPRGRRISYAL